MSAVTFPQRTWASDPKPEALRVRVLISSRDGAPVPPVPAAVRMERAAKAAGWQTVQAYALAEVPPASRRPAHRLESVSLRLMRGGQLAGWVVWYRASDRPSCWRFEGAQLHMRRLGARELLAAVSAP